MAQNFTHECKSANNDELAKLLRGEMNLISLII